RWQAGGVLLRVWRPGCRRHRRCAGRPGGGGVQHGGERHWCPAPANDASSDAGGNGRLYEEECHVPPARNVVRLARRGAATDVRTSSRSRRSSTRIRYVSPGMKAIRGAYTAPCPRLPLRRIPKIARHILDPIRELWCSTDEMA